ncbi:MAG: helix-turn-helix transcriptional regulator [Planctomycetes bacterium]|nr:helix-turn-helix transcriptional regulator [Planctomycetota bacterium]
MARRAFDGWACVLSAFARPEWARRKRRPWEVACVAACGLTNKTIAEGLRLSPRTVQAHLRQAHQILGTSSRDELPGKLAGPDFQPLPPPGTGPGKN